jgi:hypothetical protein
MRRLQQLIVSDLVWVDDELFFFFKKNKFSCQITRGGLLWKCVWKKPDGSSVNLFRNSSTIDGRPYVRTFESLTDWTETAIQECLQEYHTRYSSWKRVRHARLEQPMETIYKHLQQKKLATKTTRDAEAIGLFEQIAALTDLSEQYKNRIDAWEQWHSHQHPESPLPFAIEKSDETRVPRSNRHSLSMSTPHTQPFILNSPDGQYMMLHSVNETQPDECKEWLNCNEQVKDDPKERVKETMTFDPPGHSTCNWAPVDNATCKRFVHTFFK